MAFIANSLLCLFTLMLLDSTASAPAGSPPPPPSSLVSNTCDAPDEAAELRKDMNQHLFYPTTSSYGVQTFDISHELPKESSPPSNSELVCPVGDTKWNNVEPSESSSCPWKVYDDYNPERIPRTITMVKCYQCDSCLDSNGDYINSISSCLEVFYNMPVLMRDSDCVDGMFQYKSTLIKVPVACTCQRLSSALVSNEAATELNNSVETEYILLSDEEQVVKTSRKSILPPSI